MPFLQLTSGCNVTSSATELQHSSHTLFCTNCGTVPCLMCCALFAYPGHHASGGSHSVRQCFTGVWVAAEDAGFIHAISAAYQQAVCPQHIRVPLLASKSPQKGQKETFAGPVPHCCCQCFVIFLDHLWITLGCITGAHTKEQH